MILQPCNVELTKVHYYDHSKRYKNMSISTLAREEMQNSSNKDIIIKRNIFGHRWVLQINESERDDPKKKWQRICLLIFYLLVIICILLAMGFGFYLSWENNAFIVHATNITDEFATTTVGYNNTNPQSKMAIFTKEEKNIIANKSLQFKIISNQTAKDNESISNITSGTSKISFNITQPYCHNCTKGEVCMKTEETEKPRCIQILDKRDPTGCGGLCTINTEYCKNLDKTFHVYQCLPLKNLLKCPENTFNCGNMCVSIDKRCNGQIDCSNMIDEKNCECNLDTHFQCGNDTSCLENIKLCNGKVDCWDKSDEVNCQKDIRCGENQVPCLNGQCIPKEKMCDKVFDCLDKSDEPLWCQQIRNK